MTQATISFALVSVLWCALTAGQGPPAASQPTEKASRLERGSPIEREISGRRQDVYEVALTPGEYADVVVEQRGVDVVVSVRDAAGKLVAEFDAESRTQGQELAGLVAQSPSPYRVSVRPR